MKPSVAFVAAALAFAAAGSAQAAVTITAFGANQWGASDAALGIAGYQIEDFEDVNLTGGLQVERLNGAVGNFAATSTLPSTSVFNGATDDPFLYFGQPLMAFSRGAWDGDSGIINNPGPSFSANPTAWYQDSFNWRDLNIYLPTGVTSVGFSVAQAENADLIYVNGALVGSFGSLAGMHDTDTQAGLTFLSRNGYLRLDSDVAITSVGFVSLGGDGFMIDHFAFNAPLVVGVPEPGTWALMIGGFGLAGAMVRRRRAAAA